MYHAKNHAKSVARSLRQRSTKYEAKIWRWPRGRRFHGAKFRRQCPIGPYVVDFYCDAAKLAIELDGSWHGNWRDRVRTEYLEGDGVHLLRIPNRAIEEDEDTVARIIEGILLELTATGPAVRKG